MFVETQTPTGRGLPPEAAAAAKPADPGWAWAPYEPDAERPWDLPRAGHLFRRAAFGADWDQLQKALSLGPQGTVEKLLCPDVDPAAFNADHDRHESAAAGSAEDLRAWWLRRMILTPHPLLEKMTLFWHGHFAISGAKVKNAALMQRHLGVLRSHALGRFDSLLEAVSRDPAVLIGLDAAANRRAQPNENYTRALMQVFTLGPGHFSQSDVREAARAFTGRFALRDQLRYFPGEHDAGTKRILGREGPFDGEDVVRIVLEQPATPRLVVRKLYRWLISETDEPGDALVGPLAESFAQDYDVLKLVGAMLRSNLFFSAASYRRRVKSPVEFALGIVKGLEGVVSTTQLGGDLAGLGQNLCYPPTVKGWPGGTHWINGATLLGRSNLALALLSGSKPYGDKLDPQAVATGHGFSDPQSAGRFLLDLFLQGDLPAEVRQTLLESAPRSGASVGGDPAGWLRRFAHAVTTLPEFQLA